jgi:molybdenum cofactor cytidylyltransferase
MSPGRVTGVVLAAGSSRRLGQPKQVLPYRDSTLLGETLRMAGGCGFSQLIVTLGGAAAEVIETVPLGDVEAVVVDDHGSGCSASLKVAMSRVDPSSAGLVVMLGDQPGVSADTVQRLLAVGADAQIGVCRYDDGIGHPFWLSRSIFGALTELHGDKGVWKLLDSGRFSVCEVAIDGPVPLDVDTWDDYQRLLTEVSQ